MVELYSVAAAAVVGAVLLTQWQNNEIKALHQLHIGWNCAAPPQRRRCHRLVALVRFVGRNCACDPCVRDAALESIIYCLGITCRRPPPRRAATIHPTASHYLTCRKTYRMATKYLIKLIGILLP